MRVYIASGASRALAVAAALMLGCSKDPQASSTRGPSGTAAAVSSAHEAHPGTHVSGKGGNASGHVVGVIHYTGVINGTARFYSSDCTVIEHSVLPGRPFKGLDAPALDASDSRAAASDDVPGISVVPWGQRWHIMFDAPPSAAKDRGKTVLAAVVKHGVKIVHHGDQWQVVLHHVKFRDAEFLTSSFDHPKQGFAYVSGHISCQRMD